MTITKIYFESVVKRIILSTTIVSQQLKNIKTSNSLTIPFLTMKNIKKYIYFCF